jgi:hypothetical protein
LRGQDFGPGLLRVVEDERNKIDERFFGIVASGVRRTRRSLAGLNALTASTQQCEEILMEDQAEDEKDQRAADADVNAAKSEATTPAAAGFIAAIFDVGTFSTVGPTHWISPSG